MTICGDTRITPPLRPDGLDILAVLVCLDEGVQYPIVRGDIMLSQPFGEEQARITTIASRSFDLNTEVAIYLGQGMKHEVYRGLVRNMQYRTLRRGMRMVELNCAHVLEAMRHYYLKEDISLGAMSQYDAIEAIKQHLPFEIVNEASKKEQIGGAEFHAWKESALDCIKQIATHCLIYADGTRLVVKEDTHDVVLHITPRSNIVEINYEQNREHMYHACHVIGDGVEYTAYDERAQGIKELVIKDDKIHTEWEAKMRAEQELYLANQATLHLTITLAGFVPPVWGDCRIALPGVHEVLPIASYTYRISDTGLLTTISFGKPETTLKSLFAILKRR